MNNASLRGAELAKANMMAAFLERTNLDAANLT